MIKILRTTQNDYCLQVNYSWLVLKGGVISFVETDDPINHACVFESVNDIRYIWSTRREEIVTASIYSVFDDTGKKILSRPYLYPILEDIFVTAIEGGSNYWMDFSSNPIRKIYKKGSGISLSEAFTKAIVYNDITISILDADNPDEEEILGIINMDIIRKRLDAIESTMYDRNGSELMSTIRPALFSILNEDYDAEHADVLMQYFVLNDIVFG